MPITMTIGQSVDLTAEPLISGAPGGVLPGPINWNHNMNSGSCLLSPTTGETITLSIQTVFGDETFQVTATSGSLTASITIDVQDTAADGIQITPGAVTFA